MQINKFSPLHYIIESFSRVMNMENKCIKLINKFGETFQGSFATKP